ncbi:unnamed protein product [Mytilus coruscus]|uniref:Uncharacterized protein n=1 Tax=Mytilus coruscus TaxID=42192 RepID=A0A6J8EQ65_MYTCO|nr:unnamed protein product [Mytilus coruscus]
MTTSPVHNPQTCVTTSMARVTEPITAQRDVGSNLPRPAVPQEQSDETVKYDELAHIRSSDLTFNDSHLQINIQKRKEKTNTVAFYTGGAGLLLDILIGMLLAGVKNKCCSRQQRVSEPKIDERQYPAKGSIEIHRYEYIDEEHMTHQHQGTVPPSLPVLRKFGHQCKKASDNNYTDAVDGQNAIRIEDEGYLNPYQPIQQANIYEHEYRAIGAKITKNKQMDEYLHPYNSLVKHDMSEGHEYKDLRNAKINSELKNSGSNKFQSYV